MAQYPAASTTVTVTPSKLVTKSNTAGPVQVGGAAGLTGANGTSAYGQVSASLGADTLITSFHVALSSGSFSGSDLNYVDIAIGGAGSESIVATVPLRLMPLTSGTARKAIGVLDVPVRVASGQRLAVRITDGGLSGTTPSVAVYGVTYTNVEGN